MNRRGGTVDWVIGIGAAVVILALVVVLVWLVDLGSGTRHTDSGVVTGREFKPRHTEFRTYSNGKNVVVIPEEIPEEYRLQVILNSSGYIVSLSCRENLYDALNDGDEVQVSYVVGGISGNLLESTLIDNGKRLKR
jgi:hypothetical protein